MANHKLYYDSHIPLSLVEMVHDLASASGSRVLGSTVKSSSSPRQWLSQQRSSHDPTTETVRVTFKEPLSVSYISLDVIRMSCRVELWYRDRQENWRQMMDLDRVPLRATVSTSGLTSWYNYASDVFPIVATMVEIRITRVPDPSLQGVPYSVGVRNTLIKRNIHTRDQATQAFADEQDVLGNVVSRYVKDWAASDAIDGDAVSHWRSGAMPSPDAVVCMYLDMRDVFGNEQTFDAFYLDPVYAGQDLNIYYSSDDTVSGLRASPISVIPDVEMGHEWRNGLGRVDDPSANRDSLYSFPFSTGPIPDDQPVWMGLAWRPGYDSHANSTPSEHALLFSVKRTDAYAQFFSPQISYDPARRRIVFSVFDGFVFLPVVESDPITFMGSFEGTGHEVRVALGWHATSGELFMRVSVWDPARRAKLSDSEVKFSEPGDFFPPISINGQINIEKWRGVMTAMVIKLEHWEGNVDRFLVSPAAYCSPEALVTSAPDGEIPSTPLDNSIYSADWATQEHGMGGPDHSFYTAKRWTPVWRDYVTQKGVLALPEPISAKYLKLEFSRLHPEPYPIFESGIDVLYQKFPINVEQEASLKISVAGDINIQGGALGGAFGLTVNDEAVRWQDPLSIFRAGKALFFPEGKDVNVGVGTATYSSTLPNLTKDVMDRGDFDLESNFSAHYEREAFNDLIATGGQLGMLALETHIPGISALPIPWDIIANFIPNEISGWLDIGDGKNDVAPVKAEDMWVFPGAQLALPAEIMEGLSALTASASVRARYHNRLRFNTTSVHQYTFRTLRRTEEVAYFAGVREVTPMMTSYLQTADHDEWHFPTYTSPTWAMGNVRVLPNGLVGIDDPEDESAAGLALMSTTVRSTTAFSRLRIDAFDSGLLRSDSMWASEGSSSLSRMARPWPEDEATPVAWSDDDVVWADTEAPWGAAAGQVRVSADAERLHQGRYVLRISRGAGGGEAGLALRQNANLRHGVIYRVGCSILVPADFTSRVFLQMYEYSNDPSSPIDRLIHEEEVPILLGQWTEWRGKFHPYDVFDEENKPILDSGPENYYLRLITRGGDEGHIWLSDLFTEVAGVRYMVSLSDGRPGSVPPTIDITDLVYEGSAYVAAPEPTTVATLITYVVSPNAWALGLTATPTYVR